MEEFKRTVEKIVREEIDKVVKEEKIFLETPFCLRVFEKHNGFFTISTIRLALRRLGPELGLTRRHLTNELKQFYKLETKGCPIAYLPK